MKYAHNMRISETLMKSIPASPSRKRPVNLTLSEDLVSQAKAMTDNLSGVVESLLSEFVERERRGAHGKGQGRGSRGRGVEPIQCRIGLHC